MMLEHLRESDAAERVMKAIEKVTANPLEIEAVVLVFAASRMCWARRNAQLLLAEGALTLPPLQAQQCGNGGKF
jgi:hypothetical protein